MATKMLPRMRQQILQFLEFEQDANQGKSQQNDHETGDNRAPRVPRTNGNRVDPTVRIESPIRHASNVALFPKS